MARRLPVYLLIDTSGSMKGEPIESVKVGIETMLSTLRNDPYALETVNISIITSTILDLISIYIYLYFRIARHSGFPSTKTLHSIQLPYPSNLYS